jgi:hypothetical protein
LLKLLYLESKPHFLTEIFQICNSPAASLNSMEKQVGGRLIELYILSPIFFVNCLASDQLFPSSYPHLP